MDQLSIFDDTESYRFPEKLLEFQPHFVEDEEATALKELLIANTNWQQTTIKMYDKILPTPRLIAWYGDHGSAYNLGGQKTDVLPWTPELYELKQQIAHYSGQTFNSVLLNYYRNGNDSVAWHRDKEHELGTRPVIASLSLGQTRNFDFRAVNNHSNKYSIPLTNGALLLMKGDLQVNWEHRISKAPKLTMPRINLTFRLVNIR
ncbi:MAG: alpha-ketoglutarate-dependent dioxygenase AlkB [Pedobacter sp.]|nr:MAG: alpha-ketoglutarate-dependent dioxygenase AlkB [Pedobacter sp.]